MEKIFSKILPKTFHKTKIISSFYHENGYSFEPLINSVTSAIVFNSVSGEIIFNEKKEK